MTTKTICRACHRAALSTTSSALSACSSSNSNSSQPSTRDLPRSRSFTTETFPQSTARGGSSKLSPPSQIDPSVILSTPTWSVRSLLPPSSTPSSSTQPEESEITPQTLHHLARLSALPPPSASDPASTTRLLSALHSHLHFVRAIQSVDTTDPSDQAKELAPLSSIRDESPEGLADITIDLKMLEGALAEEDIVGHCRRPRRRKMEELKEKKKNEAEDWDVLGSAEQKVGRYFVVRSGKKGE
ncbi:hypothetical protein NEUTE1DRAFT_65058 [Neurospora tetrasperma FGSC 2508]|uniref:Glutamyl-tRNA amidotransferase complex subunit Gta3 domain-containing protein n=1 Tax=Neurospora tetrasperma (strain FGSC 2508 / ATCC MYA-4615 / P0657) TaxID=510951 RepID=F8MQ43_NEUT8|nr:uncharacterized protein NEUTE1DRAFT_65058 [Neurospora tetrasperma FGSC 2508]EGO56473.1 hypothetical protein NEUTE1DRAFT_65058 [Neurospora tetrasperma FGSC 2508]EGZ70658.1 hypothetical protein NEUTE2DRAFT_151342 [Neurospora tetrasperma FGSC 2509]